MRVPALLFCALSIASAQTRDERPTFEVAAIGNQFYGTFAGRGYKSGQ